MPMQTPSFAPGIIYDETALSSRPLWVDGDYVRFHNGMPEPIGGWQKATEDTFIGVCRNLFQWSSIPGRKYTAVGTHRKLYAYLDNLLYDITPIDATAALPNNPVSTTSGSATVTITDTSHQRIAGAYVYLTDLTATGGLQIGGTTTTLANNPISVTNGGSLVIITDTAHGLSDGDMVTISGATTTGGIDVDGLYTIKVIDADSYYVQDDEVAGATATGGGASVSCQRWKGYPVVEVLTANTYTITASAAASSTATGGGAGGDVRRELNPGYQDASYTSGFGIGGFGSAGYAYASANPEYRYPRTWSLDNINETLYACPRGGGIYSWGLNISERAVIVTNAPTENASMAVSPEGFLFAIGTLNGSTFDPMFVRNADADDVTIWTPADDNSANFFREMTDGSRSVVGRRMQNQLMIWTDRALYGLRFSEGFGYTTNLIGTACGLIGPNAVAAKDGMAIWMGVDKNFYIYTDGPPQVLDCPMRDWLFNDTDELQYDKITAVFNGEFNEFWCFFPSADEGECDRYVSFQVDSKAWAKGTMARTAVIDRILLRAPMAADTDGVLWFQEQAGAGANGNPIEAWIESSPIQVGEGDASMSITQIIPDFKNLTVGASMTIYGQQWPFSSQDQYGPYVITDATPVVDVRAAARQISFRIESLEDGSSFWRLGRVRINATPNGKRG